MSFLIAGRRVLSILLTFIVYISTAPLPFAQTRVPLRGSVPATTNARVHASAGLRTIRNDKIEVGVDLNYGGALTYLAFLDSRGGKVSTRNMVNNADLGRQVQLALYGGPLDYSKNGSPAWAGLGWDPIQAGDTYDNPSRIVAFEKQDNLLYVKTIPKQFAINNQDGEATIEHWIRLEGNVVKVHAKVVLFRSDKTQYDARQQEFPCVYLNGEYYNMWYYKGSQPFSNGSLDLIRPTPPDGWVPFGDVYPTEPWMASTNPNGYGVGLYLPNNYDWKKGYFGSDLGGDEFSETASYIAATNFVLLDHNITHEWDYELVVGHLDEIRSYVYRQPRPVPGPNYRFDTSRKGWYYYKTQDSGWPINGKLHILLNNTPNNHIKSPFVSWPGSKVPKIYVRAAFRNNNSQSQDARFRLNWRRSEDPVIYPTPDRYMDFPVKNDGQYHTYEIDLSKNGNWLSYNIGQIQLQPDPDGPRVNGWLEIEWIATSADGPVTEAVAATPPTPITAGVTPRTTTPAATPCIPRCPAFTMKRVGAVRVRR